MIMLLCRRRIVDETVSSYIDTPRAAAELEFSVRNRTSAYHWFPSCDDVGILDLKKLRLVTHSNKSLYACILVHGILVWRFGSCNVQLVM